MWTWSFNEGQWVFLRGGLARSGWVKDPSWPFCVASPTGRLGTAPLQGYFDGQPHYVANFWGRERLPWHVPELWTWGYFNSSLTRMAALRRTGIHTRVPCLLTPAQGPKVSDCVPGSGTKKSNLPPFLKFESCHSSSQLSFLSCPLEVSFLFSHSFKSLKHNL